MGHDYESLAADYKKNGFVVVDNFLPEIVANEVEARYLEQDNAWEYHDQVRKTHFSHVCKTDSPYFPNENEVYSAKFWRSGNLEAKTESVFDEYFKPALKEVYQAELSNYDVRCYKLEAGDYYRTHIDDWAGNIGCIYYVNREWIWDWGGILHAGPDDGTENIIPIFPKFNRAVFIDHGGWRFPHFISQVTEYALNPRLSMISFNK